MGPSNRLRRVLWTGTIVLAIIGVTVAVRRTVVLFPMIVHGYRPPARASNPVAAQFAPIDDVFARYRILTLIHIIPGLLFMILGPFQFSASLRARHPKFHRINGRIFLVCATVVGISALIMSLSMPAIGGVNQAAATTLFGTFFLFALGEAFWHIRRPEIAVHREWMIRAFATGLAVATIRPIIGFFFATNHFTGLTPHEFFGTAFWLGFTLQLIVAEAWIHYTRPPAQSTLARAEPNL